MTLKQIPNSLSAPDGSQYVTLTDGAGNLVTAGGGTPGAPVNSVQFNSAGSFAGNANFQWTNASGLLIGPAGAGASVVVTSAGDQISITKNFTSFIGTYNSNSNFGFNPVLALGSGTPLLWSNSAAFTGTADSSLTRIAPGVIGFGTAVGSADKTGWYQWNGQTRVTSDFSVTSSTALTNVTGLSVNVQAGRTYYFEAILHCTDAAAGGVQAAIAGTATATNIIYDGVCYDANTLKGQTRASALATAVASTTTTGTTPYIEIRGTITVNAAGTLTVQFAQNTSSATASVVKQGSRFIVNDIA